MSIRPTDNASPPAPERLMRVPRAPEGFTEEEVAAWQDIARSAMALGTLAASDLHLLARTAKVSARADALLADPRAQPAHIAALINLLEKLLRAFGLSPLARRGVAPLPAKKPAGEADPLDDY